MYATNTGVHITIDTEYTDTSIKGGGLNKITPVLDVISQAFERNYIYILLRLPVSYDISPLKRAKLIFLTTSRQASG
jgi:hypothetical protein